MVWAIPEQLQQSEVKHPEFDEGIHDHIRQIQTAFAELRPLSFEEWAEGFRRDANPAQEIVLWSHAAGVYTAFTADETSAEGCRDVYRLRRDLPDYRPERRLAYPAARGVESGGNRGGGQQVLWQR